VAVLLLALLQANAVVMDIEANHAIIDAAARDAAAAGASVLVTPELFTVGYAPQRVRAELEPASLPELHSRYARVARRHGIGLVYSLPHVTEQGEWHISATLVDADANTLLRYDKVHLFGPDERAAFRPAAGRPAVVDFNGIPTSMVICYDVEFPETVRAAAVAGAELLLVPTALSYGFDDVPQVLLRARSLESQLSIVYANHVGVEENCRFLGGSVITGSDGTLLAAGGDEAQLLYAAWDESATRRARSEVPYLDDRRPELYRSWPA
jgi:predicted amidohydrolase